MKTGLEHVNAMPSFEYPDYIIFTEKEIVAKACSMADAMVEEL